MEDWKFGMWDVGCGFYIRTYASSTKTIWFLAQERLHKSSIVAIFAAIPVYFGFEVWNLRF